MLRIGIVGAGSMGQTHAEAWSQTPATIAGVVSRTPASAKPLAAAIGAPVFESIAAMLPHIDVLDICTPTDLHLSQAAAAFGAARDVVCEKPIARSVPDAQAMIDAAASAGRQLLIAHVVRYFDAYAQARERVRSGELGDLRGMELMRRGRRPEREGGTWFADDQRSGGVMLDLMIHDFDYALWLAGPAARVSTRRDSAGVEVRVEHAGGVVSLVRGSWSAERFETAARITGSARELRFDSLTTPRGPDPYVAQARALEAALSGREPFRLTARDALEALRVSLAAIESDQAGRPIDL